jgi:hypothetical protein
MLDGRSGPAAQMAMSIVVQMAGVYGATRLMSITAAHIDSTIYIGEAGLEFGPCHPTGPEMPIIKWSLTEKWAACPPGPVHRIGLR